MDPRTPVIVGVGQHSSRDEDAEPIELMTRVGEAAITDSGAPDMRARIDSARIVKGIWPYRDPGSLVSAHLGLSGVTTALTELGGNGVYDLLNETAQSIQRGELGAAMLCSAETMRTRRRHKAAGRRSDYLDEPGDARPDLAFGSARDLADRIDVEAGMHEPVNFYAMVDSAIRHRRHESVEEHRLRIESLWARASVVASTNPHAWITSAMTAERIGSPTDSNRMVASPYPKLLTSNIDVDQAAAVVICSAETAASAGVPRERWAFLRAGSGAYDHWVTRTRWALDESPALRVAGRLAIELAPSSGDDIDLLDLYSCFPSSVQVAQRELAIDEARPFTVTGGLTFAGGPYNSYCMHALARAVELLRAGAGSTALLNGNGGFFTKHSFTIVGASPGPEPFRYERPQSVVDRLPSRPEAAAPPARGQVEAYTVSYDRSGDPARAIIAVLDNTGARTWARNEDRAMIDELLTSDLVGAPATLEPTAATPLARLGG